MSDSRFNIQKKDFYTLVTLNTDKLDTQLAPILKSEFVLVAGNGEKNLLIDMSNVHYCDSSGLSTILVANRLSKNAHGTFVICCLNPPVARLISISQLDSVLNIADTQEEAVRIISKNIESSKRE
jgi:anti-anti-sigma factor